MPADLSGVKIGEVWIALGGRPPCRGRAACVLAPES